MTPTALLHQVIDPGLAFMTSVIGPKPTGVERARAKRT